MNAAKEAELLGEIETLRQLQARTEQEKSAVVKWHDELVVLADERNRQIEALQHAQANFQQMHTALTERYDEQVKRTTELKAQIERLTHDHDLREAERNREMEALRQLGERLEHEKSALVIRYEEQVALTAERQARIEQLSQASDVREAEIARQVEALRQQQEKFDQEILALAAQAGQAEKLAAERLKKINELQQQIEHRQAGEAELATRQQLMHEEMVRAEGQLDLIKDMLLREPGL